MMTLIFGIAYKLLKLDDDLQFMFVLTTPLDGIFIYALIFVQ